MSNDNNVRDSSKLRSSLNDIISLISEYPRLSLPVGVVVALFGLATVFKTLIDGFKWAYEGWGYPGVLVVVVIIVLTSLAAIQMVSAAVAPRPVIQPFPAHHLSRSPIIKWEYKQGNMLHASYELRVKRLGTGKVVRISVPERMHQIGIPEITGNMEVSVIAVVDGKRITGSRRITTEIYRDSIQRIRETGKLRVAVHTDPGEEIFCFFQNGRWQGFDIDFASLIASELQQDPSIDRPIEVEYFFYEWPAIISAPNEHEVDMAIGSISRSEYRIKKYGINFSAPYAESKLGVVAYRRAFGGNKPADSIKLDALKGKTIAVHNETTASALAEKMEQDARYSDIKIVVANNNDELRELLRDNNVDAAIYDYQRAFTLLEAGAVISALDHGIDIHDDQYSIAFARVNAMLLDKVDAIIMKHPLRLRTMLTRSIDRKRRAIRTEDSGAESAKSEGPVSSARTNVFVYGSLMYEQVWRRLGIGEFPRKPARLSGYRRLRIKSEEYPGLVKGVGTVPGIVWLDVDDETLRRLDSFEADCYQRIAGVVVDDNGAEIAAEFFEMKDSHRSIVEEVEWDPQEFERAGLSRFVNSYAGFSG